VAFVLLREVAHPQGLWLVLRRGLVDFVAALSPNQADAASALLLLSNSIHKPIRSGRRGHGWRYTRRFEKVLIPKDARELSRSTSEVRPFYETSIHHKSIDHTFGNDAIGGNMVLVNVVAYNVTFFLLYFIFLLRLSIKTASRKFSHHN
jgi:hypothetical protein